MKKIDLPLLFLVILLSFFGLLMIYSASSFIAFRDFADKYHYVKDQTVWLILGFSGLTFFSLFDYRRLHYLSLPALFGAIALLIMVFLPGVGVHVLGARRWINLGFTVLQPAEVVKLSLAIYLAAWFSSKERGRMLTFCLIIGTVLGLVMLEPDMGTASVILFEVMVMYFLSGGNIWHFFAFIPALLAAGFILIKIAPYRAARLAAFMGGHESLENTSYHVKQILIALGSGGITGLGLGNSLQKYAYLPENTTDSIFAIIAEEFGFIGSVVLLTVFVLVVWRGMRIASKSKDSFGKLLAGGIIAFLGIQAVINLAAQTALLPLTGIPLPFISYGGSALVIDLCSIGIILNISRHT